MTKNERIKQLEDKIEALEARIAMLEVRPIMPYVPVPNRYPPLSPFTLRGYLCTCGSTAGCPVHGPFTIVLGSADTVTMGPNDVQWSYAN